MAWKAIVTEFLIETVYCPRPKRHAIDALSSGIAATAWQRTRGNPQIHAQPTTTGSTSEFYIEPMTSCVGDIDVMFHFDDQLALPEVFWPHVDLPGEFGRYTNVYKIRGCNNYPGYVYLIEDDDDVHISTLTSIVSEHIMDGPAIKDNVFKCHNEFRYFNPTAAVSADFVYCIRCPVWPTEAAEWPVRRRYHGWPDVETIVHAIGDGCDVVPVGHPSCTFSSSQWRLSFSRAEIVLLNTWTLRQQIVYHMLRFFAKNLSMW